MHNTKFGNTKNIRQSKKLLHGELSKIAQIKPGNIKKKKINEGNPKALDPNMTHNIMKMIKKMHKAAPRPGVHYRARTTEIGNSRYIKRQPSKRVSTHV